MTTGFTIAVTDTAGASASNTNTSVIATATPAAITSIVATGAGITNGTGDLDAGQLVTLTTMFNEAVIVAGGIPALTLNDGGEAIYATGSGTDALTFPYTILSGQNTPDLAVTGVALNDAAIDDPFGSAADLAGATDTTVEANQSVQIVGSHSGLAA